MSEYGFSLSRIFPYQDRIEDSDLVRENAYQRTFVSDTFYVVLLIKKLTKS